MTSLNTSVLQAINHDYKKRMVWAKGTPIPGRDPDLWRYDAFLSVMRWTDYGDRSSPFGWEFDHFPIAVTFGGSDDISNLRPLHYRNNASLGAGLGGIRGGGLGGR
jgi:hypothetical protein